MQRMTLLVLPILYLVVALWYSAHNAPWGRNVDPEYAYAMNSLTWAGGGAFHKADHPGTTTLLLGGLVIKALAPRDSILEYGAKNLPYIIYVCRAVEIILLSLALLVSGEMVRRSTRLSFAIIFQTAPFLDFEMFRNSTLLEPESLLISLTLLGTAMTLRAALAERPTIRSGIALGVNFALSLSSKILAAPLAIIGMAALLKSPLALLASILSAWLFFWYFNETFNPEVFSTGKLWLISLFTHKGRYGTGDPGFIDWTSFLPNMLLIVEAAPQIFVAFALGCLVSMRRIIITGDYRDRVSLTSIAFSISLALLMVATAKHFAVHYMIAGWATCTGAIVLLLVEVDRSLQPIKRYAPIGFAVACVATIAVSLLAVDRNARQLKAENLAGAAISQSIAERASSCDNVTGTFLNDPDDAVSFGVENALGTAKELNAFVEAYKHVFRAPMFEHGYYQPGLHRYFQPYSYARLSGEYPCIVVRHFTALTPEQDPELFNLHPETCNLGQQRIYTVGISCAAVIGSAPVMPAR
jgi:hypothetical protein